MSEVLVIVIIGVVFYAFFLIVSEIIKRDVRKW